MSQIAAEGNTVVAREALEQLAGKVQISSLRAAVFALADDIRAARNRGVSLKKILEALHASGLAVPARTLSTYLSWEKTGNYKGKKHSS